MITDTGINRSMGVNYTINEPPFYFSALPIKMSTETKVCDRRHRLFSQSSIQNLSTLLWNKVIFLESPLVNKSAVLLDHASADIRGNRVPKSKM